MTYMALVGTSYFPIKDRDSFFIDQFAMTHEMQNTENPIYVENRPFWESTTIDYTRGACLLRMISHAIGKQIFDVACEII